MNVDRHFTTPIQQTQWSKTMFSQNKYTTNSLEAMFGIKPTLVTAIS